MQKELAVYHVVFPLFNIKLIQKKGFSKGNVDIVASFIFLLLIIIIFLLI